LERIVKTDKPIIASTAGASLDDIDKVVSFFEHRNKNFALMHCVSEYPTKNCNLQLNQIDLLRERYPQTIVGYSTHESPNNFDSIKIAISKGATIFEKHVGVQTEQIQLNAYSATPAQVKTWLKSAQDTLEMLGEVGKRYIFTEKEISDLRGLRRGVYAKGPIIKGKIISEEDVFFAIPVQEGQVTANDFSKYTDFVAKEDIAKNELILQLNVVKSDKREKVFEIVQKVKALLKKSNVVVPGKAEIEISHHYGIDKFEKYGITMITVVNREYCKKLIIVLPGQYHPEQFHNKKEETFHVLYGDIQLNLDGSESEHKPGDVVVIEPGVKHSFKSNTGAIIEEISSTHYKEDSFYTDPKINENKNRKTFITYWLE